MMLNNGLLPTWFPFQGWHVVVCSGRTCMTTWTCLKPCFDISQSSTYTWNHMNIYCTTIRTLPTHTLWWASKNSKGLFKARVFNFPSIAFCCPFGIFAKPSLLAGERHKKRPVLRHPFGGWWLLAPSLFVASSEVAFMSEPFRWSPRWGKVIWGSGNQRALR